MDIKSWVSIYAAIVSTIVFLWRIYEFFDDRRGKITIKIRSVIENEFIPQTGYQGDWRGYLIATITNLSKNKRHIKKPFIEVNKKIEGKNLFSFHNLEDRTSYPTPLEPGEEFEFKMQLDGINKNFKDKGVTKIKLDVSDTHDKRYSSKWFDLTKN